jgi:hypothetical protein
MCWIMLLFCFDLCLVEGGMEWLDGYGPTWPTILKPTGISSWLSSGRMALMISTGFWLVLVGVTK